VALHDGNGWVECRCGRRHWGRHGAAGLLLVRPGADAPLEVLVQLRADWTHQGGTWAVPGGALDSDEDVVAAALREAHEEVSLGVTDLEVIGKLPGVDHIDWSYTYVLASIGQRVDVAVRSHESDEVRWLVPDDVSRLPLHPGFGEAWPALRRTLAALPWP
jgi:8-oxo-dGTP diphosphatase